MRRLRTRSTRLRAVTVAAAAAAVALAGCQAKENKGDLVAGKKEFVGKCGSCHILNRAGTKGVTGPNLDQAFQQALHDGFKRDSIRGIVEQQIKYPNIRGVMPNADKLGVSEAQASDIGAYVSSVVAKPGKDAGALATAVGGVQKALAVAQSGKLDIPADPNGQLLYLFKNAEATAGPLTIDSKNASAVPHDIAVEGNGVSATGPVVQGGGTSSIKVTVKPGTYQFFCTVPGHRQAGMQGKLTVK